MRDRNYRREVRQKAINKKLKIRKFLWGTEAVNKYYEHNPVGSLDKGKVHCSCPLCRTKSYDELSKKDKSKLEIMNIDLHNLDI